MLATYFSIIPLPEPFATTMKHTRFRLNYLDGLEVVAWLRGEEASHSRVVRSLGMRTYSSSLGNLLKPFYALPELPEDKTLSLNCSDRVSINANKAYLKRHFHLFEDILDEFPDTTSLDIPYPSAAVTGVLETRDLVDCIECLDYFNPKSNLYYFLLGTSDVPSDVILRLSSSITEEEKTRIIEARSAYSSMHLLNDGRGIGFLSHLLECHDDVENIRVIFKDYPSYLTILAFGNCQDDHWRESEWRDMFDSLILTADYGASGELRVCSKSLQSPLLHLIQRSSNWKDIRRLLTMMNVTHKFFDNENDYVPAPYFTIVSASQDLRARTEVIANIAEVMKKTLHEVMIAIDEIIARD